MPQAGEARVFPAYAGMFRCRRGRGRQRDGFPRIRGDVPSAKFTGTVKVRPLGFSPHTRGCSDDAMLLTMVDVVFPAYAGMFLAHNHISKSAMGFPRIRGDVPRRKTPPWSNPRFSPHTRGCSVMVWWFLCVVGEEGGVYV